MTRSDNLSSALIDAQIVGNWHTVQRKRDLLSHKVWRYKKVSAMAKIIDPGIKASFYWPGWEFFTGRM